MAEKRRKRNSSGKQQDGSQVVGFLGVGLDNQDGEYRLTRNEHFLLVGGSKETHERMQETSIRFNQALQKSGRTLSETPVDEIIDMLRDAQV
ncbi:MAG: hypothetical protein KatS3mg105_2730 [Gemmatales bacterium]|nr:MAG: hypothetical protein KatS3mg105_2730 [Gemmatales bacterium]